MADRALTLLVVFLGVVSMGFAQDIQTRKVYTVAPVEGGLQVDVGGTPYGPYAGLEDSPWFSADGKAWGMVLRKPDGKIAILVNGQEKAAYKEYNRCSDISLGPDGSAWSVRADLPGEGRTRALRIVDGKAYGPFDQVEDVNWSPAGKGWYFVARTGSSVFVVREGKKYGPMQDARDFAFDAPGKKFALVELKAGGSWVRVDDREYGPYDAAQIVTTGNGAFLGYFATLANGSSELTVADKRYGPYNYVDWGREYVSADGKDWLVMVFKGARRILLQNGKETDLGRLSVYKLAKGWMYTYEKGQQQFVVFNGRQFGPFQTGRNLTTSRDGSTWAISHVRYANNVEQSFVTVNGAEYSGTAFTHVSAGAAGMAGAAGVGGATAAAGTEEYFSWVSGGVDSDALYQRFTTQLSSRRLYSVTTGDGGITVAADGKSWGPYQEIAARPATSPDGSHWGLLARTDENHFVVLIDGKESTSHGPYDRGMDFSMSGSGAGWSFTAVPDARDRETVKKIVNGQEFGPFAWADKAAFSNDGKGFFFWARLPGKEGNVLTFNGKRYGPYTSDPEYRVFDVEAGHFAMKFRAKDGVSVRVDDQVFGPYQDAEILQSTEYREDAVGRYFGFVAFLKDGHKEIHVQGGTTYGPYKDVDFHRAWMSEDGQDWLITVRKDGSDSDTLLQYGVETDTQGFDIRGWAGGYLVFVRQNGIEGLYSRAHYAGPYSKVRSYWITQDSRTWVAEAAKGDGPSRTSWIVVNGEEHPGERLRYVNSPSQEYFTWLSRAEDGSGTVSVLKVR